MAFLHFNFTHIFFEANESLKYGARLQAALLKADIFTHSGTLSLWMKSFYLALEVCVHILCVLCVKKKGEFGILFSKLHTCLHCVQVCVLVGTCSFAAGYIKWENGAEIVRNTRICTSVTLNDLRCALFMQCMCVRMSRSACLLMIKVQFLNISFPLLS